MIQRKSTFFLGIFIFLVPFLGFPNMWKLSVIAISGIYLIILSIKISLPKKGQKTKTKKEKITAVFVENVPVYPKENTSDFKLKVKSEDQVEIQ